MRIHKMLQISSLYCRLSDNAKDYIKTVTIGFAKPYFDKQILDEITFYIRNFEYYFPDSDIDDEIKGFRAFRDRVSRDLESVSSIQA
jgi:hypothetical protein